MHVAPYYARISFKVFARAPALLRIGARADLAGALLSLSFVSPLTSIPVPFPTRRKASMELRQPRARTQLVPRARESRCCAQQNSNDTHLRRRPLTFTVALLFLSRPMDESAKQTGRGYRALAPSPVVTGTPLYRYSGKQRRHCGTLRTGDTTTTRSPRCLR